MTQKRLRFIVVGGVLFSLPSVPLMWYGDGGRSAAVFATCLLVMLLAGLAVARRI